MTRSLLLAAVCLLALGTPASAAPPGKKKKKDKVDRPEPTPEELAALPPHMRMKEICERRHAPFRLVVRLDGETVRDELRKPSGAAGDRPLYVFEDIPVPPGPHRIEVEFREESEGGPRRPPLLLDEETRLDPRAVVLVTLDDSGERLVLGSATN